MPKKVLAVTAVTSLLIGVLAGYAYSGHDLAVRAGAQTKIMAMYQNDPTTITSETFTTLTTDTITVPASGRFRAVVRFTGQSDCRTDYCVASIFVNGVETNPKTGTGTALDNVAGTNLPESVTMEGVSDIIVGTGSPRPVDIDVRVRLIESGTWTLDNWSVVTELVKGA